MTSKVVVMFSILMIAISIIPISEAASIKDPYDEFPAVAPVLRDICPSLEAVEYPVTVMGSDSPQIGGCAFINDKSSDIVRKSFNVWLGSLNQSKQRCREKGMDHYRFSCLSETPLQSEDSIKENSYIQLNGRLTNKEGKLNMRCALYEIGKSNSTLFRMVISGDDSCYGLSDILSQPQPIIPDGAMLVRLNRTRYQLRLGRSTDYLPHFWQTG